MDLEFHIITWKCMIIVPLNRSISRLRAAEESQLFLYALPAFSVWHIVSLPSVFVPVHAHPFFYSFIDVQ